MKLYKIVAASALLLGLSSIAYADMGKCGGGMQQGMKCGSGMMGMKGDFKTQKTQMLTHLSKMRECVEAANSKQDLKDCKMKMMQKKSPVAKKAQCGTGKCGGGK